MTNTTNRRAVLGGIAAAVPFALAAAPAVAAPAISSDPIWPKLVADFRAKYASWFATIDLEDDAGAAFRDACASLPPEPAKPDTGLPDDLHDLTIREIKASADRPEYKAAWAAYEHDHAAWKTQRDALHEQAVGPARATYRQALAIRSAAFDALTSYRVTNLRDLSEKIEIIAEDYAGDDIPHEYVAALLADTRRLAGVR